MRKKDIEFIFSNKKVVKSGSLLEFYVFGKDFVVGKSQARSIVKSSSSRSDSNSGLSSARRSKKVVSRLIRSNSFYWFKDSGKPYRPITLTLTFAKNITDLKKANYEFSKFIKRLNYEVFGLNSSKKLKYLAVWEVQKRGAIHYHMIFFNLPYMVDVYNKMRKIWRHGRLMVGSKNESFKQIKDIKGLKKVIDYFVKYIQKSFEENLFPNSKRYFSSRGLLKPVVNSFSEVVDLTESLLSDSSLTYKYLGEKDDSLLSSNFFLRWFNYFQYDLSSTPEVDEKITSLLNTYNY